MDLYNELPEDRVQGIEDFLTFIPIYQSKRRERSLRALLRAHKRQIKGKVCCEAGAGKGIFSREMQELGAEHVYAIERSDVLFNILQGQLDGLERVEAIEEDIEYFQPEKPVDVLFHELYGSLVLDEPILALQQLEFEPEIILPDGGRLWAMPLSDAQIMEKGELYDLSWKEHLSGALIGELFEKIPFEPVWEVFHWDVWNGDREFYFELPEQADWLAFCGEITHEGRSILKMWYTHNWQKVFTPVAGKAFKLRFEFEHGYSTVHFDWE